MSPKRRLVLIVVLAFLSLPTSVPVQAPPPAVQWVPPEAVICLHVSRPKALLDFLGGKEMTQAVTSTPLYQALASQPKFTEFLAGIKFLETSLETDWRTALARLVGGGITLAVCPQDTVIVIVDAEDDQILQKLHEVFLNITRGQAEQQGHAEKVASKEYAGVTAWTFNGTEAHAIIGKRLIFSSKAEGLKTVLDLRNSSDGKTLATTPAFQAAQKAASPQAAASVFVNLKPLLGIPNVAGLLEKSRTNPLAALAFAGVAESIHNSNWLSLDLTVEGKTLTVRALTDGKIAGTTNAAAFAQPPKATDGAWPNLAVPRRIAALSLYRDLRGFYAAKDTLFPERTAGLDLLREHDGHLLHRAGFDDGGPGGNGAPGPARRRRAAVRSGRRDTPGQDSCLCGRHAAAPPGAVRQGGRGGLAESHRPGQLHAGPEGPARLDYRSPHLQGRQIHRGLLLRGRCQ